MTSPTDSDIKAVALVDDHPLVFGTFTNFLADLLPNAQVRAFVSLKDACAAAAAGWVANLVVLDLHLPDGNGPSNIRRMQEVWPDAAIAVCSGMNDRPIVMHCIDEGACAFISKNSPPEEIREALRAVIAGGVSYPRSIVSPPKTGRSASDPPPLAPDAQTLTTKQIEVLNLLMRGQSNKNIARALNVAEGTIKAHISAICQKLGVKTRVEAVIAATRLAHSPSAPPGLVDLD